MAVSGKWSLIRAMRGDDVSNDAALFQQLDQVFAEILSAMTPARRLRTARGIATTLRRTQSQRIGKQVAPDGTPYQKRHRRVLRSQAGIGFIWQGKSAACVTGGRRVVVVAAC